MIEDIRQNINTEIEILREISGYLRRAQYATPSERKLLMVAVDSLRASIRMINNSLPKMLDDITIARKLPRQATKNPDLEKVTFKRFDSRIHVVLNVDDRNKFIKELSISEDLLRRIKKAGLAKKEDSEEGVRPRAYIKVANSLFLKQSMDLIKRGHFKPLAMSLRRANIEVLLSSYVSVILFSALLSIFFSIFIWIFLIFFQFSLDSTPFFFSLVSEGHLTRAFKFLWVPIIIPIIAFMAIYNYPNSERESLARKIEQELPFAVIHMSSISGSGIEPTEIFKIIGTSSEYPTLRREIRKVLNQINLYGYDLVTALHGVSKTTPSPRLAELFSGLAVTITSGGELSRFFEKRAESLLLTYRLDREKYTKTAETFMDIYISIVIAAPMILMVLMIMMQISSVGKMFSPLTVIMLVSLMNILFLVFLNLKQVEY
ncbi:MAG: type II secretion system F family protein [Nanoarchaeota archaeon]|nr:type II secretion system F family protein [Nanoarchaeota archaeon]